MPGTENTVVDKRQEQFKGCPQAPALNFCSHLPAVFISYDLTLVKKIDSIPFSGQPRRERETFSKQLNTRAVTNWIKGLEGNKQGAVCGSTGGWYHTRHESGDLC